MSLAITILVGTMSGTAELVAEEVKDLLEGRDHTVEIIDMDKLDRAVFARPGLFLVCTSTYGQGDVPDNAMDFYNDLVAGRPDLANVRYGVIGLGDTTYTATYNFGGKRFDDILSELGAKRIGERFKHNASGGTFAEEDAVEWAKDWIVQAEGEA